MVSHIETGYLYDAEGNRVAEGNIQLVNGQMSEGGTRRYGTLRGHSQEEFVGMPGYLYASI